MSGVKRVTDIIGEITAASHEQAQGIEQVNQAIAQMDQVTQQNAALVEEAAAAAQSLQEQADSLSQVVATFKLDDDEEEPAAVPPRPAPVQARVVQPVRHALAAAPQRKPAAAIAGTSAASGDWETF